MLGQGSWGLLGHGGVRLVMVWRGTAVKVGCVGGGGLRFVTVSYGS